MGNYQDGFNDGYLRAATFVMREFALKLSGGKVTNELTDAVIKRLNLSPLQLKQENARLGNRSNSGPFEHAVMGTFREEDGRIPKGRLNHD